MQLIQDSKTTVMEKDISSEDYRHFESERAETQQQSYFQSRDLQDDSNELTIQLALHHPSQQVLRAMREALRDNNYKGVETLGASMIVVRMKKLDRIKKVLFCIDPPKYIVKLTTLQYASKRLLTLKSLHSDPNIKQMKSILSIMKAAIPPPPISQQEEYRQDIYSLDPTASYMFDKILMNDKYSIGKKTRMLLKLTHLHYDDNMSQEMHEDKESIRSSQSKYHNSKISISTDGTHENSNYNAYDRFGEKVPPPPITIIEKMDKQKLEWIHNGLNEIGDDMLSTFNCSRKQLVQILGFCRKSVQEYYYLTLMQEQANNCKTINYNSSQQHENLTLSIKGLKQSQQLKSNLPLTENELKKLIFCNSSQQIFKRIFYINCVFKYEASMKQMSKDDINQSIEQFKASFKTILQSKIKIVESSVFRDQYLQYVDDFLL